MRMRISQKLRMSMKRLRKRKRRPRKSSMLLMKSTLPSTSPFLTTGRNTLPSSISLSKVNLSSEPFFLFQREPHSICSKVERRRTTPPPSVWTPTGGGAVWGVECGHHAFLLHIPHLDLAAKVAETSDHKQSRLGVEHGAVTRSRPKVEYRFPLQVEHGRLGWHEPVHNCKDCARGSPLSAVDWPLLGQAHHSCVTLCVHVVQLLLPIVAPSSLVHLGLGQQ